MTKQTRQQITYSYSLMRTDS
uniref:Uncharacterized protein n=1 Tax=Rhizophora mucronata TaxID=61149 RepID=A0A2P2NDG3_RHIMU